MDLEAILGFWAPDAVVHPAGAPQIEGLAEIEALYRSFFDSGLLKEVEGLATHLEVS